MSFQITEAFVQNYKDQLYVLAQQKGSRLRKICDVETGVVGSTAYRDRLGATSAQARTSRHADTPLISTPHSKRKISLTDYDWADLIDNLDTIKTLIDPANPYMQAGYNALGRSMDDVIIAAIRATAYTGTDGSGTATLSSTNKVAAGSTNLSLAKLISAKSLFGQYEVDEGRELFLIHNQKMLDALLADSTITSADYNTVKALVDGKINQFMGFTFVRSERVESASTTYYAVAVAKDAIKLLIGADMKGRISERADKNYATQCYACMSLGAVRMEENAVVEIGCIQS